MTDRDLIHKLIYALVYDALFFDIEASRNRTWWTRRFDAERYNAGWVQRRIADDHYEWLKKELAPYLAEAHALRQAYPGGCGADTQSCVFCEIESGRRQVVD